MKIRVHLSGNFMNDGKYLTKEWVAEEIRERLREMIGVSVV